MADASCTCIMGWKPGSLPKGESDREEFLVGESYQTRHSNFRFNDHLGRMLGRAIAQRGGKAEPNRIEFKRGTTSTIVSGTVRGDEEAEYVLAAKKGQRLIIKLTSVPVKSAVFKLLGEN